MESALSPFKRPVNGVGANNALPLKEMHQERKKKRKRPYRGRGQWTESQDLKLIELVAAYGLEKWDLIGEKMQTRTGHSCRMRWLNELDPTINRTDFTKEEEKIMLSAHKFYGNKWSKIAKLLNRRTHNAVRNHWNRITKPNIRLFTAVLNRYAYTVPGLCNRSCNMRHEEATNLYAHDLQEENNHFRMPVQPSCHHHHFPTFPAGSLQLFTPHVNISQPSPSSPSPSPEFIDFIGVGHS